MNNNWELVQVLSAQECNIYLQKINKLRNDWIQRSSKVPFYTLGMAGYLDGPDQTYYNIERRIKFNKLILDNFKDLQDKICYILTRLFNIQTELYDNCSIPGFHIYLPSDLLKTAANAHGNTPHMDLQFKYVFPEKGFKQNDFISFTLALSCGVASGLNIWKPDIELPENVLDIVGEKSVVNQTGNNPLSKYMAQSIYQKPKFIKYNVGSMFIHNGIFFHYPVLDAEKTPRITLQGHGIKKNNKLLLFW